MQTTGFGDLAASIGRQQQIAAIKRTIEARSQETVTGLISDPATAMRGQMAPLVAIEATLERLRGWDANIDVTNRQVSAMQLVFDTIESYVSPAREGLMSAAGTGNEGQIRVAVADAREKLEGVLSVLNTRVGERSIFSGIATDSDPFVGGGAALLAEVEAAVGNAASAEEMIASIEAWFDDPTGFSQTFYRGSDTELGPIPVGDGQSVSISVTGDHPALRDTLKAFVIAAMADQAPEGSGGMAEMAAHAGRALLTTAADRALVSGTLGLAEGKIEIAGTRNTAERSALELTRTGLLNADPFESASALSEAQTQLETLFATTARMMRLSLLNYL